MMRREISSTSIIAYRVITPVLCICSGAIFAVVALYNIAKQPTFLLVCFAVWLVVSAYIIWFALNLKAVDIDDGFLYVSNYRKEIEIPLSQIESVHENFMERPKLITLKLSEPSEFGKEIAFIPPERFFGANRSHPLVKELKQIIKTQRRE
jgi:hypothetical protein